MTLDPYRATRDGPQPPQPPPQPAPREAPRGDQPIFVVQEHQARRLHYDFRLEAEGVLKSWAVPKAPSMDPAQKRLAIHVEDHPLIYATFQGTIPDGQYGAGTVTIWDQGTYNHMRAGKPARQTVTEGIEAGHLELMLHGTKLQGRFALVGLRGTRRGKNHWLLIKMQDDDARPARRTGAHPPEHGRTRARTPSARTSTRTKRTTTLRQEGLRSPHPEKLMYPEAGITKGDLPRAGTCHTDKRPW